MKYQEIHFPVIDSTNLYVKKHYKELDNFTFVSSLYQTKGKGRNKHLWYSNPGDNLLCSILIKDKDIISKGGLISLITACTISNYLEKNKFSNVNIKWPNDIYINNKKVAGILLESQIPEYVVIGVGLNVNQKEFTGDYHISPTSLYLEKKDKYELNKIKEELLDLLIDNLIKGDIDKKIEYFNLHNYLLNKKIKFIINNTKFEGIVLEINNDFSLKVEVSGEIINLDSGEVEIVH